MSLRDIIYNSILVIVGGADNVVSLRIPVYFVAETDREG